VPESPLSGRQWPAPGEIPFAVEIVESIFGVLYLAASGGPKAAATSVNLRGTT
jgi:hypothetical protein